MAKSRRLFPEFRKPLPIQRGCSGAGRPVRRAVAERPVGRRFSAHEHGRLPYAGPRPDAPPVMAGIRKPSPSRSFQTFAITLESSHVGELARSAGPHQAVR
jgi:hypothetical protein